MSLHVLGGAGASNLIDNLLNDSKHRRGSDCANPWIAPSPITE
jgi:hypothetical protein